MPRRWICTYACMSLSILFAGFVFSVATAGPPIRPELASSRKPMMALEEGWRNPPKIARTRCWWWWLNGNVTRDAITRDLEQMKAKGYGGANVIDAGGAEQGGHRPVPHGPDFASPDWRKLFVFALAEADRLGLELGFNILSGWNLGGPGVQPEQAAKKLTWSEKVLHADSKGPIKLSQPPSHDSFYRDIAVVAFRQPASQQNNTAVRLVASSAQGGHTGAQVIDGDPATFWVSQSVAPGGGPQPDRPEWLELRFAAPVKIDRVRIVPRAKYGPRRGSVEVQNGDHFRSLADFTMKPDQPAVVSFPPTTATRFRVAIHAAYDPRFPDRPRNVQVAEVEALLGKTRLTAGGRAAHQILHFEEKAYYKYPGRFTATKAWHLLDTAPETHDSVACRSSDVMDVSQHLQPDGTLDWHPKDGPWIVLRFGYTITGARVSTHSDGWDGLAVDYLDKAAFDSYWQRVMRPILADAKPYVGRSLRFLHTDSWELGPVNWTATMPAQFARLRGYELTPYLPVLANYVVDGRTESTRFLNDFRRTLADLITQNNYVVFAEHAHAIGVGIHPESGGPHAAPIDALQNLGISDVPMGEFWARAKTHRVNDDERFFVKQTSSAAHVYGRRVALAEAFTTIGPQWERDPRMLKPTFDRAACEGHNLTMWHTFDCSPAAMGLPGQDYFAGTHLNPQVTWWPQAGAFIGYMNRCQFLLQQGLPVSDVAHYYGENIPSFVRLKRDDPAAVLPGYDYDIIDTTALLTRTGVDTDGNIVLTDGTRYHLLSLTPHDAISLKTLRHIAHLVQQGATVVGPRPRRQYSLTGAPASDTEFRQLVDSLWGTKPAAEPRIIPYGKGRMISGRSARSVLAGDGLAPDFTWTSGTEDTMLDYVHRVTDKDDIYFVANRSDRHENVNAMFRVTGRSAEFWDPVTGTRRAVTRHYQHNTHTVIPMTLNGEQSVFVIFRGPADNENQRAGSPNFPTYRPCVAIGGPWHVQFDPQRRGPGTVTFDKLINWATHKDPAIRYYSGPAVYETTFPFSPTAPSSSAKYVLDLGDVKNVAQVHLNGHDLGVAWCAPFQVNVGDTLRAGSNHLVVTVVNLWPNRLIGDQHLPPDQRPTKTNIRKFTKDSPLLPSGLLGPVRILSKLP